MNLLFSKAQKVPATTVLDIDGEPVTIDVKVSARARSYRLTVPHHGAPVLTLPSTGRWSEAEGFLGRHRGWLAARLKRSAPRTSFSDGELVPLRGVPHRIHATGRLRGRVEVSEIDGELNLLVPGEAMHIPRRLTEWLKGEAQRDLLERSNVHAATLGVVVKSVAMRSQSTRWGSCSSSGRLNYNWRLVLAPPFVLDYVAAHEVAHLVHMNHSPSFWKAVEAALPDMTRGKAWLKAHGKVLMGYGLAE
ncbi:SprT family zinc-dependent metalloprotease [Devosia sp. ZB163]|uniref:M48 family metallopeptidase n=1 Tax=Devosia sp. ZB163 TaxID=3025938 RepID=UPI00235F1FBA|nr:SprT family zinc-dependent metalloprotease [Devosia sp. ZB163]MDC9822469.1 SprT family zinc-dependent metalloprotease [Devosia sp. ZB163]